MTSAAYPDQSNAQPVATPEVLDGTGSGPLTPFEFIWALGKDGRLAKLSELAVKVLLVYLSHADRNLVAYPSGDLTARCFGMPTFRCDGFDAFGASKVVGAVISLTGFRIRDVREQRLARYENQPAKRDQVGFELFANHSHGYVSGAITLIKTSAS